jgi:hypothetical protein
LDTGRFRRKGGDENQRRQYPLPAAHNHEGTIPQFGGVIQPSPHLPAKSGFSAKILGEPSS